MKKHPKKSGRFQLFQFSIIGASNALIDIGTLNLLLLLFHSDNRFILLLFNTISYSLAVLNSYLCNATITFKRTSEGSAYQRLAFIVQAIVSLIISNIVFIGAHELFVMIDMPSWWNYNIAKLSAMLLSSIASFFMVKFFVFKDY